MSPRSSLGKTGGGGFCSKAEREREKKEKQREERGNVQFLSRCLATLERTCNVLVAKDSWRMKRGRDHGGNLFIEPSRDLSGPG